MSDDFTTPDYKKIQSIKHILKKALRPVKTGCRAYEEIFRRRPTLPHSYPCSTIGAKGLNFRVRDGFGCFPFAITTEKNCMRYKLIKTLNSIKIVAKPHGLLVPVSSTCCHAYTPGLSTLSSSRGLQVVCFHTTGYLISRWASRLDAFSGYPFRT